MNELLQAAKAVIAQWDRNGYPVELVMWEPIKQLRAAVERAENPPAGYGEWTSKNAGKVLSAHEVWTAAQQAERERCREIVITMGGPEVPDLLRQIDSGEE